MFSYSRMCYSRMCSLIVECVIVLLSFTQVDRAAVAQHCARTIECVLLLQNVFSYLFYFH